MDQFSDLPTPSNPSEEKLQSALKAVADSLGQEEGQDEALHRLGSLVVRNLTPSVHAYVLPILQLAAVHGCSLVPRRVRRALTLTGIAAAGSMLTEPRLQVSEGGVADKMEPYWEFLEPALGLLVDGLVDKGPSDDRLFVDLLMTLHLLSHFVCGVGLVPAAFFYRRAKWQERLAALLKFAQGQDGASELERVRDVLDRGCDNYAKCKESLEPEQLEALEKNYHTSRKAFQATVEFMASKSKAAEAYREALDV